MVLQVGGGIGLTAPACKSPVVRKPKEEIASLSEHSIFGMFLVFTLLDK
jgi:hypothetical protein